MVNRESTETPARTKSTCRFHHGGDWLGFIDGKPAAEPIEGLAERTLDRGLIALQLHDKGMIVEFWDPRLRRLESPGD